MNEFFFWTPVLRTRLRDSTVAEHSNIRQNEILWNHNYSVTTNACLDKKMTA